MEEKTFIEKAISITYTLEKKVFVAGTFEGLLSPFFSERVKTL